MNPPPDLQRDPFSHQLTGRRLGRYEVLTRLASGGMASVYVARGLGVAGFERLFAIKVLHPHLAHEQEFVAMFLDEARLAARIRNPNVVSTIDISDSEDAGYYLVMDYIEGDHLGALLQSAFKRNERLPFPISLRIVVDTLDGLAAAHDLRDESDRPLDLVHRDISPHNIMVSTDGSTRLTDFGVAKANFRLSTTRDGQFKGKLAYMAPEHASDGTSDQRSDLFAAAIVLWESLTGKRLFRAENQAATLNKVCLDPIPAPSTVDPRLQPFDAVLAKGLSRSPAARFQTAHAFAEAIEKAAPLLGGLASPRTIGRLVKDLASEKLARDERSIKLAIANLAEQATSAEVTSQQSSGAANPTTPANLGVLEAMGTDEIADSLEPEATGRLGRTHNILWTAALMTGIAGGVALATWLWGRHSPADPVIYETVAATRIADTLPAFTSAESVDSSVPSVADAAPGEVGPHLSDISTSHVNHTKVRSTQGAPGAAIAPTGGATRRSQPRRAEPPASGPRHEVSPKPVPPASPPDDVNQSEPGDSRPPRARTSIRRNKTALRNKNQPRGVEPDSKPKPTSTSTLGDDGELQLNPYR